MTHVTVKFLRSWTNSSVRSWVAGDLFERRGRDMERALARLSDWTSCCWEVRSDGTYLVPRIGPGEAVAVVANVRTTVSKSNADRLSEMSAFTD